EHRLCRGREDARRDVVRQLLRERGDGEREQRRAAHGEDVVERIRRRDAAERGRVVDERREEVDGEDERALVVELVDGRVVGGIEADEQVLRLGGHESAQELLEPGGGVLRGASAAHREAGERGASTRSTVRTVESAALVTGGSSGIGLAI